MKNYTFSEYQKEARKTAVYDEIGHPVISPVLGLLGESGEVAERVKKNFHDHGGEISQEQKELLLKDLGDILWYLSQTCTELGVNLEDVALMNIEKINSRLDKGAIQ